MKVSIIVAMASNRVIGRDNQLPWRLPADLQYFKQMTLGHHLLMGRKTYESVGKPLPGRTCIVITRQKGYAAAGVLVAHSMEEALALAQSDEEVFVAGGEEIYRAALEFSDRIYLTLIHREFEGDTFFPEWDRSRWREVSRDNFPADDRNPYPYSFLVYERSG